MLKFKISALIIFSFILTYNMAKATPEQDNPLIIATSQDAVPFQFKDKDGKPAGILIDIWKLWSKKTGQRIAFKFASWGETLKMVKTGDADIHAGCFYSEERSRYLDFATPLRKSDTHFFFHKSVSNIKSIADLSAFKIGVISKDYAENYIKDKVPDAVVVGYKNISQLIQAASSSKIKVFISDTPTAIYLLREKNKLSDFQYIIDKPLYTNDFFAAVKKGNTDLVQKINQGMANISSLEMALIARNWSSDFNQKKDKNSLIIAIHHNYPPLTLLNSEGQPAGLLVDIWKLWSKKTGRSITFRPSNWLGTLEALKSGEADIHSGLFQNKSREKWMGFSESLYDVGTGLFYSSQLSKAPSLPNLKKEKVGVMGGSFQENWLRENHPEIEVITTEDEETLIKLAKNEKIKAYLAEDPSMEFLLNRLGMRSDISQNDWTLFQNKVFGGVLKENTSLLKVINKGLQEITINELIQIEKNWISNPENRIFEISKLQSTSQIKLSEKEQKWLKEHPVIRVHNEKGWTPYNFFESGKPRGFSIDYIKLIAKKLGIKIKFITGPSWGEFTDQIKEKKLDVMLNIAQSPERNKYLNFTYSYLDITQALFVRDDIEPINSIEDLFGKRFAVPKGFYFEEILREYPKIEIVRVKDSVNAIQAVAFGQADALIDLIPVVNHYKHKLSIDNVSIGGSLGLNEGAVIPLHIGVRKDWPEFSLILNKGIQALSDEEINGLKAKWLNPREAIAKKAKVELSAKELNWLKENPITRIATMKSWFPYDITLKDGSHTGLHKELLELINESIGTNLQLIVFDSWKEAYENASTGKTHGIIGLSWTQERTKIFNFSPPYQYKPAEIVISKTIPNPKNWLDLNGKEIWVRKSASLKTKIQKDLPDSKILEANSEKEALKALSKGKGDAYMAWVSASKNKLDEMELKIGLNVDTRQGEFTIGTHISNPIIANIIHKGVNSVPLPKLAKLRKRWLSGGKLPHELDNDNQSFEEMTREIVLKVFMYILIIIALIGLIIFMGHRYFDQALNHLLESNKIIWVGPVMVGIFLVVIIGITQFALNSIKHQTQTSMGDSLRGVVNATYESLSVWVEYNKEPIKKLSKDPKLGKLTQNLLQLPQQKELILKSKELAELRRFLNAKRELYGNMGFFIISPDRINMGSMRDNNIGTKNLIAEQRPELLERVFSGETVFVPPIKSDVKIKTTLETSISKPPTMFFAAPIHNSKGKVIAAFTLRIAVDRDFIRLIQVGKIGTSGETYAIDPKGMLISKSRFTDNLKKLKLIGKDEQEILNIRISDPGGNLEEGYVSPEPQSKRPLTVMAKSVISGGRGINIEGYRDYRGIKVLGAWLWDDELGIGLTTEIDEEEALQSFYTTRIIVVSVLGMTVLLSILLTAISLWLGRRANRILIKSKEELEEKVEERTKELSVEVKERQKSESLFKGLLESAPDSMIIVNEKADIILVNAQTEKVFGYSRDELIGQKIEFLIPERFRADHPKKRDGFIEMSKTRPMNTELELIGLRKNGEEFPVDVGLSPMCTNGDVMIFATARDITERKKSERAIAEAEEKSRMILDSVGEGIVGVDKEGHAMFINPAGLNMLGFEAEEILGNKIHNIFHHSHSDGSKYLVEECPMYKSYTDGSVHHIDEEMLWRKNGTGFPVDYTATPIFRENELAGAVINFQNITERKLAEEELLKLSRAIEFSPVTVVITDIIGNIIYVNPKFTQTTGYTSQEAIGQNPRVLKSGNMPQEIYEELWETISDGKEWTGELENRRKNGELYWESASISPILNSSGDITHYVAVKEDITLKKKMQDELREAKEIAEAATKAKGEFLANMSHEIRTPMNAVIGINHLLSKTTLDRKQQDYVDKIYYSAKNLLGIINDILDFSKIEAGKLQMENIDFDLNEVVENLSSIVSVKAQDKGLELVINVGTNVPQFLKGDPLRIGQVMINLANNAIKFTGEGEIVIAVTQVETVENVVTLQFSVRDTGIGLTKEQQGRLFQSFSQADTSTTRKFGGTGLGLAISKYLVEQMGGDIWIESELDQGSTFLFTAEFEVQAEQKIRPKIIPEELQSAHILIVDDNQTARDVLADYLEDFGFTISAVKNGLEAVELVNENNSEQIPGKNIELILMDWQMPKLDGLEAAKKIKLNSDLAHVPKIVMITAYGREEIFQQVEDLKLDGMLVKPITQSMLYDTIMGAFGQDVVQSNHGKREELAIPEKFNTIRGANILLVEDNEINQQVASELLEAEGMHVSIANDGKQALDFMTDPIKNKETNIVLMDLQMPVMDGYEATENIRRLDIGQKVPIIAMTADAMTGVKEKVIEIGMNDYVTKPINPKELFGALIKWIKPEEVKNKGAAPVLPSKSDDEPEIAFPDFEQLNIKDGLTRVNHNKKLYLNLLKKFRNNNQTILKDIQSSLGDNDLETAERLAHTLKGVSGNLGATGLHKVSKDLDELLKDEDYNLGKFREIIQQAESELSRVMQAVDKIMELNNPSTSTDQGPMDIEKIKSVIDELKQQLDDYDSDAVNNFETLKKELGEKAKTFNLDDLENKIEQYDFEGAVEELNSFDLEKLK